MTIGSAFQPAAFQPNAFQIEGVGAPFAFIEDPNYLVAKQATTGVALGARVFSATITDSWVIKKKEPQQ